MVTTSAMTQLPGVFSAGQLASTEIIVWVIIGAALAGLMYYFLIVRRRR